MYRKMTTIDVEKLRNDMKKECYGAYFVGGYGGALVESFDIDEATPEKLMEKAKKQGFDLRKYGV